MVVTGVEVVTVGPVTGVEARVVVGVGAGLEEVLARTLGRWECVGCAGGVSLLPSPYTYLPGR